MGFLIEVKSNNYGSYVAPPPRELFGVSLFLIALGVAMAFLL
jgi:hypothetical protein